MLQIPNENQRLKQVIEYTSNGNISAFSKDINVSQPRIARLFIIDKRSGKYPLVSFDIAQSVINKFINIDAEWLLLGKGEMLKNNLLQTSNNDKYVQILESRVGELNSTIKDKERIIDMQYKELKRLQNILEESNLSGNIKNVG